MCEKHKNDKEINRLRKTWNFLGKKDPLKSIMTGQQWQIEEFFDSGIKEIDDSIDYIKTLGVEITFGRALDFGCGVGRLTQALARYFKYVDGVDISPSMIGLAEKYNERGKCSFILNNSGDLDVLNGNRYNFIYSSITLQHIEPSLSLKYLKEMIRLADCHSIFLIQIPSRLIVKQSRIYKILKKYIPRPLIDIFNFMRFGNQGIIRMHGIEKDVVIDAFTNSGCRMIDVRPDRSAGENWESFRYLAIKD